VIVAATPWLNGKHTIFGKVVEGQDVAEAISKVPAFRDKPNVDVATIAAAHPGIFVSRSSASLILTAHVRGSSVTGPRPKANRAMTHAA
jgi:cyclophilin family peptidyl-prolyl cis-trans isomerase